MTLPNSLKKSNKFLLAAMFCVLLFQDMKAQDSIPEQKSMITFSSIISFYTTAPRYNIGYIRKMNERIWAGVEAGYGNYDINLKIIEGKADLTKDYQLFEIRPSLYYSLSKGPRLKHVLSVELFYIHHTDIFERSTYFDTDEKKYYNYDRADYKRIKYGFNINYQRFIHLGSRFAFMPTVGIGLRIRDVSFKNVMNKTIEEDYEDESLISTDYIDHTGTKLGVNLNFEWKVIYKF